MALPLLVALVASQGAPALSFDWRAPPQCPTEASVRARLGDGLSGTATASVNQTPEGFELELEVDGASRQLVATTCEEAADAAVIIIRLALAAQPPPAPAAPPPPVEVPAPARPSWGVRVAALATTDLFWLPQALARFGGALQVHRGPLEGVLELSTSLPLTFAGGPNPAAAVRVTVPFALEAGACWAFEAGPLRGGPCVTVGPTWLTAEGLHVTDPRKGTVVLWSAGPAARATLRLGSRFDLGGAAGLRFGARPQVSFEGWPPVLQGSVVTLSLSATLGVRF